jgi:uncharacterized membrane protein YphA (DoxX/SURF4 family)
VSLDEIMKSLTKVFLVLLRLAIGWHFFFEGVEKLNSIAIGETTTNRPFSSAGYLAESTGPFANFFRDQVRESDEEILNRLTVVPLQPGQNSSSVRNDSRMPPALAKEWKNIFDQFLQQNQLDPRQIALAEKNLNWREWVLVNLLLEGRKRVTKTFPTGAVEVEEPYAQRIEEYRKKAQEVRDMESKLIPAFGKDVLKEKLRSAKAELNQMRQQFLADLNEHTELMRKTLLWETAPEWTLTKVGWAGQPMGIGPFSATFTLAFEQGNMDLPDKIAQVQTPPAKYASANAILPTKTMDLLVSYGVLVIGACLLLGLFSRLASLSGATFLLMLYLAMPPFPWLPDPPRPLEGHYLFVSKNAIEMLALLTLATTRSGKWAGLDGLIGYFLGSGGKKSSEKSGVRGQRSEVRSQKAEVAGQVQGTYRS